MRDPFILIHFISIADITETTYMFQDYLNNLSCLFI
jgi:hypothetical protein